MLDLFDGMAYFLSGITKLGLRAALTGDGLKSKRSYVIVVV